MLYGSSLPNACCPSTCISILLACLSLPYFTVSLPFPPFSPQGWVISYVSNWIRHDEDFEAMVNRLVKFVDRADFHSCLTELGLLAKGSPGPSGEMAAAPSGSLTEPPAGSVSQLAAGLAELVRSKNTDLCDLTVAVTGASQEQKELQLHRAVAAARCQWLSRALQSGMREAIEK